MECNVTLAKLGLIASRSGKANAATFGTNVDQAKTLSTRNPITGLATGLVGFLEVVISLTNMAWSVFARLEMNSLPCTDASVDITKALWIEARL